ncbi:MAG: hypothetical protein ACRDS0_24310 [Pseudonocardiaceae bacterium]
MSDTLSFAHIDAQHVEMLPARTVLSLMLTSGGHNNVGDNSANGGDGGTAVAVNQLNLNGGSQTNVVVADAHGGSGGEINQWVAQKFVHIHKGK